MILAITSLPWSSVPRRLFRLGAEGKASSESSLTV